RDLDPARSRAVLRGRLGGGVRGLGAADLAGPQAWAAGDLARGPAADGHLRRAVCHLADPRGLEAELLRRAAAQHLLREVGLRALLLAGLRLRDQLSPGQPPVDRDPRADPAVALAAAEQHAGPALPGLRGAGDPRLRVVRGPGRRRLHVRPLL